MDNKDAKMSMQQRMTICACRRFKAVDVGGFISTDLSLLIAFSATRCIRSRDLFLAGSRMIKKIPINRNDEYSSKEPRKRAHMFSDSSVMKKEPTKHPIAIIGRHPAPRFPPLNASTAKRNAPAVGMPTKRMSNVKKL